MSESLRVGLIAEPAGWHLNGLIEMGASYSDVSEVAIADVTGQVHQKFRPVTGSSPDPNWQAGAHVPGSGPPEGWTKFGQEYDTPAVLGNKLKASFTDHRQMLAEFKPDAVLVTVEPSKMPPLLIDALRAGAHVFHEKPGCGRIEDYREVVEVARQSPGHLCVAFNMRGLPNVREARAIVQSGVLGKLFAIQTHYVAEHPRSWLWEELADGWMFDRDRGGGHLIFLGCHYLDLMRYVTGADVAEVAGFADTVGGEPINAEDAYAVSHRFDNGMVGSFTGGFLAPTSEKHDAMNIWGSRGWLRFDPERGSFIEWFTREGTGQTVPQRRLEFGESPSGVQAFDQYKHEFFQACLGKGNPPITADDGLWMHEIAWAARRASDSGRAQKVVLGGS